MYLSVYLSYLCICICRYVIYTYRLQMRHPVVTSGAHVCGALPFTDLDDPLIHKFVYLIICVCLTMETLVSTINARGRKKRSKKLQENPQIPYKSLPAHCPPCVDAQTHSIFDIQSITVRRLACETCDPIVAGIGIKLFLWYVWEW